MADNFFKSIAERKWKIALFSMASALIALVVSLILPDKYLSQASLLPANSKLMDKQRLFDNNIQELYSAYGNAEDLDRLFATMRSGTVLYFVTDSLGLVNYYKLEGRKDAMKLAQKELESNIKLTRSEYGELQLKVWDKDPATAKKIADLMIYRTQGLFDEMFRDYFQRSIKNLETELKDTLNNRQDAELAALRSRLAEYKVSVLNPPPAFFIMEKPALAAGKDKPRILLNVLVVFGVALFTALVWTVAKKDLLT